MPEPLNNWQLYLVAAIVSAAISAGTSQVTSELFMVPRMEERQAAMKAEIIRNESRINENAMHGQRITVIEKVLDIHELHEEKRYQEVHKNLEIQSQAILQLHQQMLELSNRVRALESKQSPASPLKNIKTAKD